MNCPECESTDVTPNEDFTIINGDSHISTSWVCNNCNTCFYAYYSFAYTEVDK